MVNSMTDCSRERETMINSEMLMTLFYGIYSFVFWRATTLGMRKGGDIGSRHSDAYAAHRSRIQRNPAFFIIAILMYTLVTVVFIIHWKTLYDVFGPNGGDGMYLCTALVSPALPIFCETVLALNIVLADLVLTWRTYVVFGKVKRIVIFPGILVLCTAVLVVVFLVIASIGQGREKGTDIYELVFGIGELSVLVWIYLGFSMGITLYCSIAITVRIFKICRLGGTSVKSYANVLEVVAESSALYTTVVLITFILVFISAQWGSRCAVAVLLSVTGISPTWILARVVSGKARTDESWTMDSSPLDSDPEAMEFQPNRNFTYTDDSTAYAPVGPLQPKDEPGLVDENV
ncbi:hypothetical protein CYLTODRAFT_421570 [Cylindrobasidium torrendii FP15055 ss-10]|uniref:Uncharacterized protein n=1 Tax=Cylindrobasidium torrendii FP15055 ss-10 TaxID=1314674 RepID=A0A0D7BE42_9AGAR|nr:hypothetical protein CYLTODRAFT_421570 [Cylindrobasidium torrendii FP15055 ss-10]